MFTSECAEDMQNVDVPETMEKSHILLDTNVEYIDVAVQRCQQLNT